MMAPVTRLLFARSVMNLSILCIVMALAALVGTEVRSAGTSKSRWWDCTPDDMEQLSKSEVNCCFVM